MNVEEHLSRLPSRSRDLLRRAIKSDDTIAKIWLCPWKVMDNPDPWQRQALVELITRHDNVLMCCSRGAGKTETFSAACYIEACLGGFAMILSRSNRQAMRIISRARKYAQRLGLIDMKGRGNLHELTFSNGGRILALPSTGDTIVGEHGITLMGLDEAARIKDDFFALVTPMLGVSEATTGIKPRLALLSTPFGQRGFFHKEWMKAEEHGWKTHTYTWRQCPRIQPEFIEGERQKHGNWWIKQEYECEFLPTEGAFFNIQEWNTMVIPGMKMER